MWVVYGVEDVEDVYVVFDGVFDEVFYYVIGVVVIVE